MKLRFKKLREGAILPTYATDGSAALDLYVPATIPGYEKDYTLYHGTWPVELGIAVEVPPEHVLLIFSRSGHARKHDVRLANGVGVVDSDYRGELMVKLTYDGDDVGAFIKPGDRIAQAMIVPVEQVQFELADELSDTARGEGGFGSTGA